MMTYYWLFTLFEQKGYNKLKMNKMRVRKLENSPFTRAITEESRDLQHTRSQSFKLVKVRLNTIQNQEQLLPKVIKPIRSQSLKKMNNHLPANKFYESKIALSCQSWSAYNMHQQKYKRGYRPNRVVHFTGFVRILLLKTMFQLMEKYPMFYTVLVRTNKYLLKEELEKESKSLLEQKKINTKQEKQLNPYLLKENTVISLKDLIIGNLYTTFDDVNQYSILFLGAVLRDIKDQVEIDHKTYAFQPAEEGKKHRQIIKCRSFLVNYLNNQIKEYGFKDSILTPSFQLMISPDQLTRLFAQIISKHSELPRILSQKQLSCTIKFQMGFRFFEERKLKFLSDWPCSEDHWIVKSKGRLNYDVLVFNKVTRNVIAMNDCKYSMEEIDLKRIEGFLKQLAKPIVNKDLSPKKQSRVKLPVLRLSE